MFQATQRSSYEQLRDQISQRAKGRSAVDFYEEGMTPLLSYMFFVLHYHGNYLTTENMHQWPIIPHSKMRHSTDRIVFSRQFSLPVSKILKDDVEEVFTIPADPLRPSRSSFSAGYSYRPTRNRDAGKVCYSQQDTLSGNFPTRCKSICSASRGNACVGTAR